MYLNDYRLYIMHHGIKGQEWGVKNGPPYPLSISEHSTSENKAGWKRSLQIPPKTSKKRSIEKDKLVKGLLIAGGAVLVGSAAYFAATRYGKKHISSTLRAGNRIHTLSADADRLKGADYIYESHKFIDRNIYKSKFGSFKDDSGVIHLKKDITSKISKNMRIASEDDINKSFRELFKNDADFKKFITTEMEYDLIRKRSKTAFMYNDGIKLVERIRSGKMDINKLTDRDINKLSKVFNYVIGDSSKPALETNKIKMFDHLKGRGFSGLIDVNDSLYGGFQTRQSNIIFDMSSVVQDNVTDLSINDVEFARLVDNGRLLLPSIGIGSIATAGIIDATDKLKK